MRRVRDFDKLFFNFSWVVALRNFGRLGALFSGGISLHFLLQRVWWLSCPLRALNASLWDGGRLLLVYASSRPLLRCLLVPPTPLFSFFISLLFSFGFPVRHCCAVLFAYIHPLDHAAMFLVAFQFLFEMVTASFV